MKRIICLLFLVFLFLFPLAFFASAQQGAVSTEKVVIRVLSYTSEPTKTVQEEIFAEYDKANENIELQVDRVPFNELYRKIAISVASESPYDVIYVDGPLTKNYAYNNIIIPLNEYFTEEELSDFLPASINEGSFNGNIYSIPERQSATAIIYNKKYLEEAGITPPSKLEDAWTMNEFLEVLKQVTQRDENGRVTRWGLTQMSKYRVYSDYSFIRSNGSDENHPTFLGISPDGSTVSGYLDHPDTIEALKFWQDLHQVYKVIPTQQSPSMFENGLSVFYQAAGTSVGKLNKEYPDIEWGIMPQPYFKTPIVHTGSFHWGVSAKSKYKNQAVDFVKYITNPENATKLHLAVQQIPARRSVLDNVKTYESYPMKVYKESMKEWGEPRTQTVAFREYEDIMLKMLKDIILGANVEERVVLTVKDINAVLSKY